MIIPDEAVPYIKWQRPRSIGSVAEVKRNYAEWVAQDFAEISVHLPRHVESILEVGCGMGGIQVFFKQRYPDAKLTLLDGEGSKAAKGFRKQCAPYSSRVQTEMLLAANGVCVDEWLDVGTSKVLKADLIVSLWSLGFHYPLNTYKLNGLCIIDLRREQEVIRGHVIAAGQKHYRCIFRKND